LAASGEGIRAPSIGAVESESHDYSTTVLVDERHSQGTRTSAAVEPLTGAFCQLTLELQGAPSCPIDRESHCSCSHPIGMCRDAGDTQVARQFHSMARPKLSELR
jgi:hypothetical protein